MTIECGPDYEHWSKGDMILALREDSAMISELVAAIEAKDTLIRELEDRYQAQVAMALDHLRGKQNAEAMISELVAALDAIGKQKSSEEIPSDMRDDLDWYWIGGHDTLVKLGRNALAKAKAAGYEP